MSVYTIRMKNCAFFARHGVHDEEEALGQRFYVDATLTVNAGDALIRDSIGNTVDYGTAFTAIEKLLRGPRSRVVVPLPRVAGGGSGAGPRGGEVGG